MPLLPAGLSHHFYPKTPSPSPNLSTPLCPIAAGVSLTPLFSPARADPERTSTHMISADDAEYPREYRTLGNGTRRFSNVGLVHTSERRHTVIAAQSLEALTGLQKSEMERKRDAFMDHLKNKYPQHALALRGQQERLRDQVRDTLGYRGPALVLGGCLEEGRVGGFYPEGSHISGLSPM